MSLNIHPEEVKHPVKQVEKSIWKGFVLNVSVVILIFILGIFLGVQLNNERMIQSGLYTRAKADFEYIVLTRQWNAHYGGVYVEKVPGVVSNPYLDNPDITATDGKVYTRKNPALMTRELSELLKAKTGHSFHITSLKLLNPDNKPDAFEAEALRAFEAGKSEVFTIERKGDTSTYRYMAPLYIEPACLTCHAGQGYKVGDVRGGISVMFDVSDVEKSLKWHRYGIWTLSLLVSILLIAIIYSFVRKVKRLLDEAQAKLRELAVTDELTGLHNRRYFVQRFAEELGRAKRNGHSLGCMMLDIDFFKRVNDTYGHQAGDHVLQSISGLMKVQRRAVDVLARYGGEEFIMLLPEASLEGVTVAAERLRASVEAASFTLDDGRMLQVTISIGICHLSGEQLATVEDHNDMISAADGALYRAKENGRNRVEAA